MTYNSILTLIRMLVEAGNYCTNKRGSYISCHSLREYSTDFNEWSIHQGTLISCTISKRCLDSISVPPEYIEIFFTDTLDVIFSKLQQIDLIYASGTINTKID